MHTRKKTPFLKKLFDKYCEYHYFDYVFREWFDLDYYEENKFIIYDKVLSQLEPEEFEILCRMNEREKIQEISEKYNCSELISFLYKIHYSEDKNFYFESKYGEQETYEERKNREEKEIQKQIDNAWEKRYNCEDGDYEYNRITHQVRGK